MAVKKRATAHKGRKKTAATKRRTTRKKVTGGRKVATKRKTAVKRKTTARKKVAAKRGGHKKVARAKGRKSMSAHGRKKKAHKETAGAVSHKKHKKHHAKSSMMEYMQGFGTDMFGHGHETHHKKTVKRGTKKAGARSKRSKKR